MNQLSKEALLAAAASKNLPRERVEVPELDGFVIVQGMTGAQRDVNTENIRARLAVQCLINEDGSRLFGDNDAAALGGLRVDVLQKIFEVAQRLSGVSDEDIDELKKFSETAAGSGSPTT